jgi:hypothetical protein
VRDRGHSAQRAAVTGLPLLLERAWPGVFAVGDVRHGSPKRIASAVGDGALAVQLVHTYLGLYAAADARAVNGAGVPRDVANCAAFLKQLPRPTAVAEARVLKADALLVVLDERVHGGLPSDGCRTTCHRRWPAVTRGRTLVSSGISRGRAPCLVSGLNSSVFI